MERIYAIFILVYVLNVTYSDKVGSLHVKFEHVRNPTAQLYDGKFCDSPFQQNAKCDMLVKACFGPADSNVTIDTCPDSDVKDKDFALNLNVVDLSGSTDFQNILSFDIMNKWPDTVQIKMRIMDRNNGNNILVDNIARNLTDIPRGNALKSYDFYGNRILVPPAPVQVTANLAYTCSLGHYSDDCSISCIPTQTCSYGFFQCSNEGKKNCLYNFTGDTCRDLQTNYCPTYKGIGESTWSGVFFCNSENHNLKIKFTKITRTRIEGEGDIKKGEATDNFTFNGTQDLATGALTLTAIAFTNDNPGLQQLPQFPEFKLVTAGSATVKMTAGDCTNAEETMLRDSEVVPACMYEHKDCYRMGERYDQFNCCCREGFDGKRCETPPDLCAPANPCLNLAVCENIPPLYADYRCTCPANYYGKRCEISSDQVNCTNVDPCIHNSTCVGLDTGFYCRCTSQLYFGELCSNDVKNKRCADSPCENNGQCEDVKVNDVITGFKCTCTNGFSGIVCQFPEPTAPTDAKFLPPATSRTAKLEWKYEDGHFVNIYQIRCIVTASFNDFLADTASYFDTNVSWPNVSYTLQDLAPATTYSCDVRALIGDLYGPYAADKMLFKTNTEAPTVLVVPVVYYQENTDTTIVLGMPNTISKTGPIIKYGIVVELVDQNKTLVKRSISAVSSLSRKKRASLDPLSDEMAGNLKGYDDAKADGLKYYIAAEFNNFKENFTIGDDLTYGSYRNMPLTPDAEYKIYYGVTTMVDGHVDTRYVEIGPPVKAEKITYPSVVNQAWLGVGITLLCLALITAVIIICLCRLASRASPSKQALNDPEGLDNPAHTLAYPASPGIGTRVPAQQSHLYSNHRPTAPPEPNPKGEDGKLKKGATGSGYRINNDYDSYANRYGGVNAGDVP